MNHHGRAGKLGFAFVIILMLYGCAPSTQPDGPGEWPSKKPKSQGIDEAQLDALEEAIGEYPFIDSFLLVRHGYLVFEKYYNDYDKDTQHEIHSITKSLIGSLIGIAIDQGYITSTDQKMMDFFPEYKNTDTNIYGIDQITIAHLLNMTSGLCEPGFGDVFLSDNPISRILSLPLYNQPGEKYRYNGSGPHLLSAVITKATGMSAKSYAETMIFDPLGTNIAKWDSDQLGNSFGPTWAEMTPRAMAWLGYLYLNEGTIGGTKIISRDWTNQVSNFATGDISNWQWQTYGYKNLWWVESISNERAFSAIGYAGQLIICIPSLDLVIVTTCAPPGKGVDAKDHTIAIYTLIEAHVIPSIVN